MSGALRAFYLLARLDEIDALIDSGTMDVMTEEERDDLGREIRNVVVELLLLGDEESPVRERKRQAR